MNKSWNTQNKKVLAHTRRLLSRIGAAGILAALSFSSKAEDFTAGSIAVDVPANSDMILAFPYRLGPEYALNVSSSSSNTVSSASPLFASGTLANDYYAFIEDGKTSTSNLSGRYYDVTSNTSDSITLNSSDSLSGLTGVNGGPALVSIHKYWTIGKAFQGGVGFFEETQAGLRDIEVIIPTPTSIGGGLVVDEILYFYNGHWRRFGYPLTTSFDNFQLQPHHAFVIRNNSSTSKRTYFFGEIILGPLAIPIFTNSSEYIDNFVSHGRPINISLDELIGDSNEPGLESILGTADRLLIYEMNPGKNKQPIRYQYTGTQWQKEGTSINAGNVQINAAQGIAIRKTPGSTSLTHWVFYWNL